MSESLLWDKLSRAMAGMGHFERIENLLGPGTPDVSFCVGGVEGWLELKYLPAVPKGAWLIHHYTKGQKIWMATRGQAQGRCGLFVQAGDLFVLLDWKTSLKLPRLEFDGVVQQALYVSEGTIHRARFIRALALL